MATRKGGLGRGISALIPTSETIEPARSSGRQSVPTDVFFGGTAAAPAPIPGLALAELVPADISPNPQQPRSVFDEKDLAELIHSVSEFGVLQPIVVRPRAGGGYELIMGERRLRAAKAAGLATIPAIIKNTADEDLLRDALLENLHRSDLNPLEEASAYQQLLEDFSITQEQLADRIGRSRPQVTNTLRLLKLPTTVQTKVAAGVLTSGHARAILGAGDAAAMEKAANRVVNEGLSVRATEALIASGSTKESKRRKPVAGNQRGRLAEIEQSLEERLNTRVRISLGAKKGQLVVDFATIADLNRILGELGHEGY